MQLRIALRGPPSEAQDEGQGEGDDGRRDGRTAGHIFLIGVHVKHVLGRSLERGLGCSSLKLELWVVEGPGPADVVALGQPRGVVGGARGRGGVNDLEKFAVELEAREHKEVTAARRGARQGAARGVSRRCAERCHPECHRRHPAARPSRRGRRRSAQRGRAAEDRRALEPRSL